MTMVPQILASEVELAPCARCARMQKTCCQRAEVLVTEGDVERIGSYSGRTDFFEHRRPLDPSYVEDDPDDPHWQALTIRPDGARRMLRRQANGDCTFLGAAGCVLPTEVRPLICRLYPYAYNEGGLIGSDEDYCPTELLAQEGRPMVQVLGIESSDAERWHADLYRELRDGSP